MVVAQSLSNSPTDVQQLAPIVAQIQHNTDRQAQEISADGGDCSEDNFAVLARRRIDGYIATGRQHHGTAAATGRRRRGEGRGATPGLTAMLLDRIAAIPQRCSREISCPDASSRSPLPASNAVTRTGSQLASLVQLLQLPISSAIFLHDAASPPASKRFYPHAARSHAAGLSSCLVRVDAKHDTGNTIVVD